MMLVLWTVVGAAALYLLIKYMSRKKYNLPPGPPGLPIIGNLLQVNKELPHLALTKLSEKYGDVFSLNLVGHRTVVLNSFEAIYAGLVTQSNIFAGRPKSYRNEVFFGHEADIVMTSFSPKWVYKKKTAMQTLKMYGDNLNVLEAITIEFIEDMVAELKSNIDKEPLDIFPIYHRCTTGIISSILYGYKLDDEKVETILKITEDVVKLLGPSPQGILFDVMPWLRFFKVNIYQKIHKAQQLFERTFKREIIARKGKREPGNPQCVVDGLFDKQEKDSEKGGMTLTNDDIYGINTNLIFAGTFTTSTTLNCLLAVLINNPKLQDKMAKIIDTTLEGRQPCLADRKLLPYIEAAILEILRYSSIISLNVPHMTLKDTTLNGYDIPAETDVLFNLWKLHHHDEYWDEPWEFKPERYLDENGEVVPVDHINRKRLLPFGASRRVCIGEVLAKNRLFLMVTSLLQNFRFLPAGPDERPLHDPRDYQVSFGIEPVKYRLKIASRD